MHLKDTNPDELIVRFRAHCRVTFERLRYDANWRASMYELVHAHLTNRLKQDYADFELIETHEHDYTEAPNSDPLGLRLDYQTIIVEIEAKLRRTH